MFSQPLLTAAEVARLLTVSPKSVYKWAETGTLPCVRFGRAIRFAPADVEQFIEAGRQNRGGAPLSKTEGGRRDGI